METQNLWPDFAIETTKSPKAILKEQAGYLMAKTNNMLSAVVETLQYGDGEIVHEFYIVAPALKNYRYRIFSITHGVFYYPLEIAWDDIKMTANDQDEFLKRLSSVFNYDATKQIISSLLTQSLAE